MLLCLTLAQPMNYVHETTNDIRNAFNELYTQGGIDASD